MASRGIENSLTRPPAAAYLLPSAVSAASSAGASKFTAKPSPTLRAGLTIAIVAIASQGLLPMAATFLVGRVFIHLLKMPKSADLDPTLNSAVKVDAFMTRQYWASVVIPKSFYQGIIAGTIWCSWCTFTAGAPLYLLAAHSFIGAGSFTLSLGNSFTPLLETKEGLIAMHEMIRAVTPPNQDVHPRLLEIAKEALESAVRGDFDSSKFRNLKAFNDKHDLINDPSDLAELFRCYDSEVYTFETNVSWTRNDRLQRLLYPFILIMVEDPIMFYFLAVRNPEIFTLEALYTYLNEEQLGEYQSYVLDRIRTRCSLQRYAFSNHQNWEEVRKSALENAEKDQKWIRFFLNHTKASLDRLTQEERKSLQIKTLERLYHQALDLYDLTFCPYYPIPGAKVPDNCFHDYFMSKTIAKLSKRFEAIIKNKNSWWDEFTPKEKQELIQIEMGWSLAKYRITKALNTNPAIYPLKDIYGRDQTTLNNLLRELTETIEKPFLAKIPERSSPEEWAEIIESSMVEFNMFEEYFCLNSDGTKVLTTNGAVPGLDLEILEMTLQRLKGAGERFDAIRNDAQQKLDVLLESID